MGWAKPVGAQDVWGILRGLAVCKASTFIPSLFLSFLLNFYLIHYLTQSLNNVHFHVGLIMSTIDGSCYASVAHINIFLIVKNLFF